MMEKLEDGDADTVSKIKNNNDILMAQQQEYETHLHLGDDNLADDAVKVDQKRMKVDQERMKVDPERMKVDPERMKVDPERMKVDQEIMKVDQERMKVDQERMKVDQERMKVDQERMKVDQERMKVDQEREEVDEENSSHVCNQGNEQHKLENGEGEDEDDISSIKTTSFNYIPEGFQLKSFYMHSKKLTDLVDVTYNPRTREFIFLDTRGITTWNKDSIHNKVNRGLNYPKYQNKLLVKIIYARKFNVYFCIAKDFSLKVLNMNFEETCNVDSDLSSVMFLIFNPVRDELITGGVKGTMVWEFRQDTERVWKEIKPMANYALFLQRELKCVGGSWVKKVELDQHQQYLYCCSDTDVTCYDIHGRLVFKLTNAHQSQITGCKYSAQARLLVTCSADTNVKVWSMTGGHVHTFRGHSKAVTNILLHPESSSLVLTSSMDGSVRLWSLEIMEILYSITVSTEGIQWMGLTGENYLWTATKRDVSVWFLNQVVELYTLTRSKITSIQVIHCLGKTSRIVAVGDDNSMRLVSIKHRKNLSTVLPPPNISPLEKILGIAYNRECSLAYLLVTPQEIWVYTMRTDPACRIGMWHVFRVQDRIQRRQSAHTSSSSPVPGERALCSPQPALDAIPPFLVECTSLTILNMPIKCKHEEANVKSNFLVLGMQDGRILFMDPIKFAEIYHEFKGYKDAILEMKVDEEHDIFITKCKCRSGALFRFWDLPSLVLKYEVSTKEDTTAYALLDDSFLTGHVTGHLALYQLTELHPSAVTHYGGIELYAQSQPSELVQSKMEHKGGVIAIDSCHELQMFVSCGEDHVVKVWDKNKVTLTEVVLGGPISSAHFLNVKGDLLIGYKNHLFLINHSKLLSQDSSSSLGSFVESESDIYEDPAVRFEGVAANPDAINMQRYLVPYNLDFSKSFLEAESSESDKDFDEEQDDESDSDMSMAPSDIYLSPTGTPRTLSVVDLILNSDFNQKDIEIGLLKLKKKKQDLKKQKLEEGDNEIFEFAMPKFGISPGPSPTVTPPSTPECSSSEIDDEEEKCADEVNEPVNTTVHPLDALTLTDVQPPKPIAVKSKPVPPLQEQESKYSLSKYKVDVKLLMKDAENARKTSTEKIVSQQGDSEANKQDNLTKKPSSPSRKVIQKKTQKTNRVVAKNRVRSAHKQMMVTASESDVSPDQKQVTDTEENIIDGSVKDINESSGAVAVETEDVIVNNSPTLVSDAVSGLLLSSPDVEEPVSRNNIAVGKQPSISNNWKKQKPTSAAVSNISVGKESDVLSTISIPDGNLEVGDSPKNKLEHGENTKLERKSKNGEKLKDRNKLSDRKRSKHVEGDVGELWKSAEKLKDEKKPKKKDESKADEKSKLKEKSESKKEESVSKDKGNVSFLKAASRLSITEKYSLLKASKRSIKVAVEPRPRSSSLSDVLYHSTSPSIPSRLNSAGSNRASSCLEDPSLADEEYTVSDGLNDNINRLKPKEVIGAGLSSLMRIKQRKSEDHNDFEEGIGSRRSFGSLVHPLFSDFDMPLKSNMDDGTVARPNTAEHPTSRRYSLERPHTVPTGDLHVTFQNGEPFDGNHIPRYISCPGSPADIARLLKNDGTKFEENWQDRMIERNQILKWQQEQRARMAYERRQLMEAQQRERRQSLLGHRSCSTDNAGHQTSMYCITRSESALDVLKKDQSSPKASVLKSPTPPGTSPPPQPRHYKEVNDLSQERAYRFRLNKEPKKQKMNSMELFERADGTSGPMLVKRPHTAQSIPGKAKYVLLKPFHAVPRLVPSPLEEQLLLERFPEMRRRRAIRQDAFERNNPTPNVMLSNAPYM